jgi:hypothetical protein
MIRLTQVVAAPAPTVVAPRRCGLVAACMTACGPEASKSNQGRRDPLPFCTAYRSAAWSMRDAPPTVGWLYNVRSGRAWHNGRSLCKLSIPNAFFSHGCKAARISLVPSWVASFDAVEKRSGDRLTLYRTQVGNRWLTATSRCCCLHNESSRCIRDCWLSSSC